MFSKIRTSTKLLFILLVFILQGALSACGSSSSNDSDDPQVSSDSSKVYVTQTGAVTVSGVVVDAVKRTLISGATVTIRVDGNNYSVTSAPAGHASPGSFAFLLTPGDSEYFLSVSTSDTYAPYFYANTTPKISTSSGGIGTQDIGSVELYTAIDTTVSVKNISGGTAISGLTLYYDTKDVAETNSSETVSISGVDIVATETAGVYSFPLPDNGVDYEIKIKELVDGSEVAYDPYNATITDNVLTSLQAGNNSSYYFKTSDTKEFTIFIHLIDENGDAFDAGEVLVLNETGGNEAIFAERNATTTNEYVLIVNAPSPITTPAAATFDYTILNLDLDGDGIYDTATAQLTTLDESTNVLDGGSFDSNREATVVVPISTLSADQNISAELISNNDKFQVNGIAQVIVAFDRPVGLVHGMRWSMTTFTETSPSIGVDNPASIFNATVTPAVAGTTTATETQVTLNANNLQYDYLDDASAAQVSAQIADANGELVSPMDVVFGTADTITELDSTAYAFSANNTLLTITLDSSILLANHQYTFEFAVKGTLSDTPVAYISKTIRAKSNATVTGLNQLTLDNFDYLDTVNTDLTTSPTSLNFTNQNDHIDLFTSLTGATMTGTSTQASARHLTYSLTEPVFDSLNAGFYLVSPVQLSGTFRVVSQSETYLNASVLTTDVTTLTGEYYGLDYTSNSGIDLEDVDLSDLTNITSVVKYVMNEPSNHGIDDTGLQTTFGNLLDATDEDGNLDSTVVTSGANFSAVDVDNNATAITANGVYYLYLIPLAAPVNAGGYISKAVLDFDVNANGTNFTGSQAYNIQ